MLKNFNTLQKILITFGLLLGIFLSLAVPPLNKADENTHIVKAITTVTAPLLCTPLNTQSKVSLSKNWSSLIHNQKLNSLITKTQNKIGFAQLFATNSTNSTYTLDNLFICNLPYFSYLLPGLSLSFFEAIVPTTNLAVLLARMALFILYYFVIIKIISKSAKNLQTFLLFFASLPMTLHQLGSFGYDAPHIVFGFLLISLTAKFHEKTLKNHIISTKEFAIYTGLFAFFTYIKQGYEPLAILPIYFLIVANFQGKKRKILATLIALSLILFIALPKLHYAILVNNAPQYKAMVLKTAAPSGTNVKTLAKAILKENLNNAPFYVHGAIGIFGWLEFYLPGQIYHIFIFLFGIIFYKLMQNTPEVRRNLPHLGGEICAETAQTSQQNMFKTKLTNNFGLMGLAICAVSILYVQLWFAIFWTKNIGVAIEGVQGRYFIVVFMFVAYFAAHLAKQKRNLFFALVMFGVLLQTMLTVITRYYK